MKMESTNIMILTGGLIFLILCVLLVWYSWPRLNKKRRILNYNSGSYPLVWAGQPKHTAQEVKSISVETNTFYDKNGNRVNPNDYLHFVVSGNSMQFCGIHDKDLLFVAKGFRIVNLTDFPYILVLKNTDDADNSIEYKIRRAWGISTYGDDRFEADVRAIMASEDFKEIKRLKGKDGVPAYRGDESVIEDFLSNRLPIYEKKYINCNNPNEWNRTVVISTTFDTDERYIHFSIHPIANIVGIVKESFTVSGSQS